MNFNPDLTPPEDNKITPPVVSSTKQEVLPTEKPDVLSLANLVEMTKGHMDEDAQCKKEIDNITVLLNQQMFEMSIKDMIDYLKVKINERKYHADQIFKAFDLAQRTELAKEMFLGSSKKTIVHKAEDRERINRLIGQFNKHLGERAEDEL